MKDLILHFIDSRFPELASTSEALACAIAEHICSPKFTAVYMQRTFPLPDLGLGHNVNLLWSKAMSAQTDAFAAALANLKSQLGGSGLSSDQVDAHIHAVVDPLTTKISAIASSESDDATKVADIQTELAGFATAFAPAAA